MLLWFKDKYKRSSPLAVLSMISVQVIACLPTLSFPNSSKHFITVDYLISRKTFKKHDLSNAQHTMYLTKINKLQRLSSFLTKIIEFLNPKLILPEVTMWQMSLDTKVGYFEPKISETLQFIICKGAWREASSDIW